MSIEEESPPADEPSRVAASLFRLRRFAEAANAFIGWAEQAPEQRLPASLGAARALLLAGDRSAAEEWCRRAVDGEAADPGQFRAHLLLARLALAENRLGQAQLHLRSAIGSRPEVTTLRATLARVMMRRSRFEMALATAQEALARDPGCLSATLVIAELHLVGGDTAKAAELLRQLEQQRPDWAELLRLRERLPEFRPRRDRPSTPAAQPLPGLPARRDRADAVSRAIVTTADFADVRPGGYAYGGGAVATTISLLPAAPRIDIFDQIAFLRALILRELRLHYRDSKLGFLLGYVRPACVMTLHYIVFVAINKYMPAKIPTELFIIGSFTPWYATSHTLRGTMGNYRVVLPAGVTEVHRGVAKMIWEFLSMLTYCFVVIAVLDLFGWHEPIPSIPITILIFALSAMLGLGLGFTLQACSRVFPATETLKKSVIWILFITSGHYFSISGGRHGLWIYMWFNPCLHMAELERHALDPGYPTELVTIWYPIAVAILLLIVGLVLNKCTRHLARD
jgi:capsular polysaccharide transport system permease protein